MERWREYLLGLPPEVRALMGDMYRMTQVITDHFEAYLYEIRCFGSPVCAHYEGAVDTVVHTLLLSLLG